MRTYVRTQFSRCIVTFDGFWHDSKLNRNSILKFNFLKIGIKKEYTYQMEHLCEKVIITYFYFRWRQIARCLFNSKIQGLIVCWKLFFNLTWWSWFKLLIQQTNFFHKEFIDCETNLFVKTCHYLFTAFVSRLLPWSGSKLNSICDVFSFIFFQDCFTFHFLTLFLFWILQGNVNKVL